MYRIVGVVSLAAAVSAVFEFFPVNTISTEPAEYAYFDAGAKADAEFIIEMPNRLNKVLSLERYTPDYNLQWAFDRYRSFAEKVKWCKIDLGRFDRSFETMILTCQRKAASDESKQKIANAVAEGIKQVKIADQAMQMNVRFFGYTDKDRINQFGNVAMDRIKESLKKIRKTAIEVYQGVFLETKAVLTLCIKTSTEELMGTVMGAVESVPIYPPDQVKPQIQFDL